MNKTLVIVEFKDEVEYLLRHQPGLFGKDTFVLSLLPEASALLAEKGIAYHDTLKYFTKQSHEETLVAVDSIIARLNAVIAIEDNIGIKQAYNNTLCFYSRYYLSHVIFVLEVINNIIGKEGITHIVACAYRNNDLATANLGPQERPLGDLMRCFQGRCVVTLHERTIEQQHRPATLRKILKSVVGWFANAVESFQIRAEKGPSVLFYSLQYNADRIARSLKGFQYYNLMPGKGEYLKFSEQKNGFSVRHLHLNELFSGNNKAFEAAWQESIRRVWKLHQEDRIFCYKNIDFSKVFLKKVDGGYAVLFKILNRKIVSLQKILKRLRPAVVISSASRELSFALGELCKNMNIPSLLISHGSHVPPKNEFERREWLDHGKGLIDTDYRYHLLQSPWASAYAQMMSSQKNYFNIFPVIFNKIERTLKLQKQLAMYPQSRGKNILVHASTPKSRVGTRLYIYETMDEYIGHIKDLIEATRGNTEVFLIIRFRPSRDLTTADLKRLLPYGEHYTVATEGTFADYLTIADVLVSFSSTTIEEALYNNIPVLQYDSSGRYMHIEGALWKKGGFERIDSVYWVGQQEVLAEAIAWLQKNHLTTETRAELFAKHHFSEKEANRLKMSFMNW